MGGCAGWRQAFPRAHAIVASAGDLWLAGALDTHPPLHNTSLITKQTTTKINDKVTEKYKQTKSSYLDLFFNLRVSIQLKSPQK